MDDPLLNKMLSDILNDNSSTSHQLLNKIIKFILSFYKLHRKNKFLRPLLEQIKFANTSKAIVYFFLDCIISALEENPDTNLIEIIDEYLDMIQEENEMIAKFSYPILMIRNKIALYSYSSTVLYVLEKYCSELKEKIFYCSECQPTNEGIELAKKIADIGLNVELYTDNYLFSSVDQYDAVISGADFVYSNGIANTIGTKSIAALCKSYKRPFYVFSSTSKFYIGAFKPRLRNLNQINKKIYKYYDDMEIFSASFDITPFKFLTYLITERRLYTARDITSQLKE